MDPVAITEFCQGFALFAIPFAVATSIYMNIINPQEENDYL